METISQTACEELACLHRQVVARGKCRHWPRHEDLQHALLRILHPPSDRSTSDVTYSPPETEEL